MRLKDLEMSLEFFRGQGATDDTVVLGYDLPDRLTPSSSSTEEQRKEQRKKYFTVRDISFGERSQEYGGGRVIRIYHYTT